MLRFISPTTTCAELYAAVETAFFCSSSSSSSSSSRGSIIDEGIGMTGGGGLSLMGAPIGGGAPMGISSSIGSSSPSGSSSYHGGPHDGGISGGGPLVGGGGGGPLGGVGGGGGGGPSPIGEEPIAQRSKITGVFTQAVEAINKTFNQVDAGNNRKWRLQVTYPFAAEDNERSVLGQGVAFIRDKINGQLKVIPFDHHKLVIQFVKPPKDQLMALIYLDISGLDHLPGMLGSSSSSFEHQHLSSSSSSSNSSNSSSSNNSSNNSSSSSNTLVNGIISLGSLRQCYKIHLSDCLQHFAEKEILDQDNMW
ncbi:ubiquitin carboxyl-terminal hydrolase, putative [Eimeria maxima]|uniref:Ubiquitin carboxyl-terminal hydrolase, putative n=1 Tax=Eimeria maxima TaxID=5804 RepID=U6M8P7_EIMMA|nr:ubiquitin carboxyl-terminal hydrolase, putative [Eimeria maxima]CDJ59448.1 ubiquitin carboxyl-terminal hydrolase, putative [Eimeria maxima]